MFIQNLAAAVLVMVATLDRNCDGWLIPRWWNTCYQDPPIGCFPTTYPYNNTGGIAPQHPDIIDVEFYFYNTVFPRRLFNIHSADQILADTYNATAKTVVLIHGYLENGFSSWIRQMGHELLQKDRHMNIVVVNWDGGSSNLIYYQSVANARVAGAVTALLLQKLIALGGDRSHFHVIGFSLGAHVAGFVGDRLSGIGRITGLDPAGPGFEGVPAESRLDPTDAVLVDVIHTDAAPVVGIGTLQPMGTVDFYPNGGANQPGCPVSVLDRVSALMSSFDFTGDSVRFAVGCSHLRVTNLFTASINHDCSYITRSCQSLSNIRRNTCSHCQPGQCPVMGYNLDSVAVDRLAGLYRTVTTSISPYCCI